MPLDWPTIQHTSGDMPAEQKTKISADLDSFADRVLAALTSAGLDRFQSPLWQAWDLVAVTNGSTWIAGFCPSKGGTPRVIFVTNGAALNEPSFQGALRKDLGTQASVVVTGPMGTGPGIGQLLDDQASAHVSALKRRARVGTVADDYPHLAHHVDTFLADHPDPARNVFIMMRFATTPPLGLVHSTIKSTLSARGLHGVRADDRDYTGDVWSNIELYMALSRYGIAVFEDVGRRDFNPNVSLELGYMLGQKKRVLLLKEQTLPTMPSDVVHKLYRSWNAFDVEKTVDAQVGHWFDNDIRI